MAEYPKVLPHFGVVVSSRDEEAALRDGRAVIAHDGDKRSVRTVTPRDRDPRDKAARAARATVAAAQEALAAPFLEPEP